MNPTQTKIKFCGMMSKEDCLAANENRADYVGFVFTPGRKRTVTTESAREMKSSLLPGIKTVGVFVNETTDVVAGLLKENIIDIAQLHGDEDEAYIKDLRSKTDKPVIQAIQYSKFPSDEEFLKAIKESTADMLLIDSGTGCGKTFPWEVIRRIDKEYFLAGGLDPENVSEAIALLHPYAVDVSSGIETDHKKDKAKMAAFANAVRKETI